MDTSDNDSGALAGIVAGSCLFVSEANNMNLVWNAKLTDYHALRFWQTKKQQKKIRMISLGAAVVGMGALVLWQLIDAGGQRSFWLVVFALSLWFDMYLVAEKITQGLGVDKIKPMMKKLRRNREEKIDVAATMSDDMWEAFYRADAQKGAASQISSLGLFAQLVKTDKFARAAEKMGIDLAQFSEILERQIGEGMAGAGEVTDGNKDSKLTDELWEVMQTAFDLALQRGIREVDVETTTRVIYTNSQLLHEIFMDMGVDKAEFNGCLDWLQVEKILKGRMDDYKKQARFKAVGDMNASYTASATPVLNDFSEDLTVRAKRRELMLCMGRDREMKNITDAFESGQQGVILVGPTQVGKRTIVEGIAQHMVEERVPAQMHDKRLVTLNLETIIGGADQALAQKRLIHILDEVRRAGNIILFVENIEAILSADTTAANADGQAGVDVGKILTQALVDRKIMLIATCRDKIYEQYVEKQALGQKLRLVRVEEPEVMETIEILMTKTSNLESKNAIRITYDALLTAVEMSKRYLTEKRLPQKAIEVLELAALKAGQKNAGDKSKMSICSETEVMAVMSDITNIPMDKVSEDESKKLLGLEDELHKYVIGQHEAVVAVAQALRRARTDLQQNRDQPLASFLFLGPTGVGKTELSKTVAKVYFGESDNMIRLDMSEYQLPTDVVKMIGSPDGSSLGYLTEAVRKTPYSLILFDEIEKAHPDILNLFLQMLDDGRMTNGLGVTVDFANTIIVATSNVGANYIQEAVRGGRAYQEIKEELLNKLLFEKFRPEFINRFDEVIVFKPLSAEEITKIVELVIAKVADNLMEKGLRLEVSGETMGAIARASYDPQYGARPVRRFIKDNLESQVATLILENKVERRDTVVVSEMGEGKLGVEVRKAVEL
ncbi:ATP-dependent Clp protease ATP-binding subunit [Microgenomates group bacterium]|nr:ATP-dependent Clp protease ATP-binding subunit [Microgenomates group bacterium]